MGQGIYSPYLKIDDLLRNRQSKLYLRKDGAQQLFIGCRAPSF